VPTELAIVGEPRSVSAVIGVSAYRIAQEALTNVRKHAGAATSAEVRVRWSNAAVEVEVTNTGVRGGGSVGASAGAVDGDGSTAGTRGLGQVGMRERVAAVGGTLELGPRARGGYLVRASFPLRREEVRA